MRVFPVEPTRVVDGEAETVFVPGPVAYANCAPANNEKKNRSMKMNWLIFFIFENACKTYIVQYFNDLTQDQWIPSLSSHFTYWKKPKLGVDLYQITITMTPVQKIQFIKVLIHERAQISPAGILKLQLNDQPSLTVKEQILILKKLEQEGLITDLNIIGKAVSFWVISTFANYLNENKDDTDVITIEIGTNTLSIDKVTTAVRLNAVEVIFNPKSQEFNTLLKLATAKNHQVTYTDILGESVSKTTKRNLTFVIRNIKEALGILPAKKAKNKDIIKNIKGLGYKLTA